MIIQSWKKKNIQALENEAKASITRKKRIYKYLKEQIKKIPILDANGNSHIFYCVPCTSLTHFENQDRRDVKRHCYHK